MEYPSLDTPTAGAFRFNTDSSQLEIYDGNQWTGVLATSPELQTGGTRGLIMGRYVNPTGYDDIDYINIATTGNSIDFGNLVEAALYGGAVASRTRGVYYGDYAASNTIQYVTIASTGNAVNFGDLTGIVTYLPGGVNDSTRGVRTGGGNNSGDGLNTLDYVTIASTGNAVDFGDMVRLRRQPYSANSPTRGFCFAGNTQNTYYTDYEYFNISSTGNSSNTGESGWGGWGNNGVTCSATRALIAGGYSQSALPSWTVITTIERLEMNSLGNAIDFGDLTVARGYLGGCSSTTRAVYIAGDLGPGYTNIIDYVAIESGGNAVDFGDRTAGNGSYLSGCSNGHGGL